MTKSCRTWGEAIRKRDIVCQIAYFAIVNDLYDDEYWGCKGGLEADHLIGRGNKAMRNNPDNGMLLCAWHHRLSNKLSHHGSPKAFWKFVAEYMPERWAFREKNRNLITKYGGNI